MTALFTPDTLKDEYHKAFYRALSRLCLLERVETLIRETRQTAPQTYMNLAALAHDYGDYAMMLGIRIYLDGKGIE